jgi:pimeloyl-ACP methyl ester carboxylesterase
MTKNIASAARPAPPIGEFQAVDGRRIFVHRLGSGGPAVVFLPGSGAVGLDYFAVQQGVSQFGTAVVYDRGGSGYSDPVALPRTAAAVATELHELLHAQNVAAPYILVAHSLGGAYAHRYTQLYPQEVAGLVWVDAFHRDWADFMPAAASANRQTTPDPEQIRAAVREMYAALVADYPQHMRQPLIEAHGGDEWLRIGAAERGSLVALTEELRAGPDLPDVPVVALTVEGADPGPQASMPEETIRAMNEGLRRMAAAVVSAVSFGEHRIVTDVGHHQLCFTRPDVVVQAIRDVVDRVARG